MMVENNNSLCSFLCDTEIDSYAGDWLVAFQMWAFNLCQREHDQNNVFIFFDANSM